MGMIGVLRSAAASYASREGEQEKTIEDDPRTARCENNERSSFLIGLR